MIIYIYIPKTFLTHCCSCLSLAIVYMVIIARDKHKQLYVRNAFWGLYHIYSLMTSIKLIQPLQYNRIKVAQKFSAFLLLYSDFVAPVNSEKTMAMLA